MQVTQEATGYLAKLLSTAEGSDGAEGLACRLYATEETVGGERVERLELTLDTMRTGDATFAHGGKVILVVEEGVARRLEERTLGLESTDAGLQLAVF